MEERYKIRIETETAELYNKLNKASPLKPTYSADKACIERDSID